MGVDLKGEALVGEGDATRLLAASSLGAFSFLT